MKVSAKDPSLNILAYVQNAGNRKNGAETVGFMKDAARQDTVMISAQGRDIREAVNIAKSQPEVREEMVEAIRARIQNGTYEMDSERIAANMIVESLFNDVE
ncbi:flagellar biosynthesis anti-sigma factor FlgM [Desulfococcus sp.]|uniref:flagellar biosynthesis anti-sigma factor FlgM n=1 Tax=Desulfococcus sp. TaxID=2025834 RepID=UPI0035942A46